MMMHMFASRIIELKLQMGGAVRTGSVRSISEIWIEFICE